MLEWNAAVSSKVLIGIHVVRSNAIQIKLLHAGCEHGSAKRRRRTRATTLKPVLGVVTVEVIHCSCGSARRHTGGRKGGSRSHTGAEWRGAGLQGGVNGWVGASLVTARVHGIITGELTAVAVIWNRAGGNPSHARVVVVEMQLGVVVGVVCHHVRSRVVLDCRNVVRRKGALKLRRSCDNVGALGRDDTTVVFVVLCNILKVKRVTQGRRPASNCVEVSNLAGASVDVQGRERLLSAMTVNTAPSSAGIWFWRWR